MKITILTILFLSLISYILFFYIINRDRIVVSLTTSPQRINSIKPVLDSILNQTIKPDRIYLNLPKLFLRNNSTFDIPLPQFITDNPIIYVNFCDDLGPATKIIPTIYKEFWPNTYILSIDDDTYYPSNIISDYLKYADIYKDCIITGTSFINNNSSDDLKWFNTIKINTNPLFNGKLVDLLEGFSGVLYKRKFFTKNLLNDFYKNLDETSCKFGDDFYLSNLFKKYETKIICLNMYINHNKTIDSVNKDIINQLNYGFKNDALHNGGDGVTGGNHENYKKCSKYLESHNDLYINHFKYN